MRPINEVLNKLKILKKVNTDAELARLLNVARNTVTNWRHRGSIPYNLIVAFCEREDISLDWLLTGKGTEFHGEQVKYRPLKPETTLNILEIVVKMVEEVFEEGDFYLPPIKKARLIRLLYKKMLAGREDRPEKEEIIELVRLAS